jgi:hypothetical protein
VDLLTAWPIVTGAVIVVFSAGQVIERLRNGKYVSNKVCEAHRESERIMLANVDEKIDRVLVWVDKQRD